MPPLRYTLRYNATTFDWQLADTGAVGAGSRHATHVSAFARLAADPRITARGATLQVFSADGGFVQERAYLRNGLAENSGAAMRSSLAA